MRNRKQANLAPTRAAEGNGSASPIATEPLFGVVDRRTLLAAGSGWVVATAAQAADPPARAPTAMDPLPTEWEKAETLPLWAERPPGGGFRATALPSDWPVAFVRNIAQPVMRVFRPKRSNGRALLTIPGGSYVFVSVRNEGLDIARRMNAEGYTVFVLLYRLPGEGWEARVDAPLQDAQRAMRVIRANATRFGFDPKKVATVGFSAGGHLAASLATNFAEAIYPARDEIDQLDARPAATGLIYPVITLTAPYTHRGSADQLLGPQADAAAIARRSPEQHVSASTPPIFLAHTIDDPAVPVQNSLLMLDAMRAGQRPVEAHFFQDGGHGFGLGPVGARAAEWPALFTTWLDGYLRM